MTRSWRYYGKGLPALTEASWEGHLVVIEGSDCAGRSTQIRLLKRWLERHGHAVAEVGLRRSPLAGELITDAKAGHELGATTRSLLYATDLADQLEGMIIPALRAGFVVLADRYFYTLMARDLVRGARREWLEDLFGFALVPSGVIYLRTTPEERLHRALKKHGALDYWESGMDLGLDPDRFSSFLQYQGLLQAEYDRMATRYGFEPVNGSAPPDQVQDRVRDLVSAILHR